MNQFSKKEKRRAQNRDAQRRFRERRRQELLILKEQRTQLQLLQAQLDKELMAKSQLMAARNAIFPVFQDWVALCHGLVEKNTGSGGDEVLEEGAHQPSEEHVLAGALLHSPPAGTDSSCNICRTHGHLDTQLRPGVLEFSSCLQQPVLDLVKKDIAYIQDHISSVDDLQAEYSSRVSVLAGFLQQSGGHAGSCQTCHDEKNIDGAIDTINSLIWAVYLSVPHLFVKWYTAASKVDNDTYYSVAKDLYAMMPDKDGTMKQIASVVLDYSENLEKLVLQYKVSLRHMESLACTSEEEITTNQSCTSHAYALYLTKDAEKILDVVRQTLKEYMTAHVKISNTLGSQIQGYMIHSLHPHFTDILSVCASLLQCDQEARGASDSDGTSGKNVAALACPSGSTMCPALNHAGALCKIVKH